MKLEYLIKTLGASINAVIYGGSDVEVAGISNDSREIKNGYLFAARKGVNVDSNIYIEEALSKGASAVLTDDAWFAKRVKDKNITVIYAKDALKAYAVIAGNFFNNPGDKLKIIGVTGTNGKTTTTFLIKSILEGMGNKTGLFGTIDYEIGSKITCSKNTTPDALELNRMFYESAEAGANFCVMEVSSHSLAQDRVYGVPYDVAVFTNLTRDHLDYHANMEEYYSAKKKFFSELLLKSRKEEKFALINGDDPYGKRLTKELREEFKGCAEIKLITYGLTGESDISAKNINYRRDGLKFDVVLPGGKITGGDCFKTYRKL